MKKSFVNFLFVTIILVGFSCQKETQLESDLSTKSPEENWLGVNLNSKFADSQKEVAAYLFSTNEVLKVVNTPNVKKVHFVLGYDERTITIKMLGTTYKGSELVAINSEILKDATYLQKLEQFKTTSFNKNAAKTDLLRAHLYSPQVAYNGINEWNKRLNTVTGIEEVTSYNGKRIQRFIIEVEIINEIVRKGDVANLGLFLGLNSDGKVTTYFMGMDLNNAVKQQLTSKGESVTSDIYDGGRPCPPFGTDDVLINQ
ncbi:MAG: hypothetical protein EAZ58_03070 [Flavobacterium sp.]|nr:MAG: hypothetical protein EAZ58_03070 [Flavobacterium sp.]